MTVTDKMQTVEFLVDADGRKKAAVLDWSIWEEVRAIVEAYEKDRLLNDPAALTLAYQEAATEDAALAQLGLQSYADTLAREEAQ